VIFVEANYLFRQIMQLFVVDGFSLADLYLVASCNMQITRSLSDCATVSSGQLRSCEKFLFKYYFSCSTANLLLFVD